MYLITQNSKATSSACNLRRRVQVVLHSLESLSYTTDDAVKIEELLNKLEDVQCSFRSSLPSKDGLTVLPTKSVPSLLTLRAKKIKKNALKRLQKAAKLSSLYSTVKKRPGRKRQDWRVRNRVGTAADRLRKVSICRVLPRINLRPSGWAWFGAEFVTTSIILVTTSKK